MKRRALIEALSKATDRARQELPGVTVCKVTAVRSRTIDARPCIARVVNGETVLMPVFVDVPPIFLQGGDTYDAHPIAVGDYCLVVVTERAYDRWYNGVDNVPPAEARFHDYSDGFALVGVNPEQLAIPIPQGHISLVGDSVVEGDYTHTGDYDLTGDLSQTGNYTLTGNQTISVELTVNGVAWSNLIQFVENHTHRDVVAGSENSGTPNGSIVP